MMIPLKHDAPTPEGGAHPPFITTTEGMAGHFAVMMWWNPDGFWEPYNTGAIRYPTRDPAIREAHIWAAAEGLEYKP